MILEFANQGLPDQTRWLFQRAFDLATKELGIDTDPTTLRLFLERHDCTQKGYIRNDWRPGQKMIMVLFMAEHDGDAKPFSEVVEVLSHELIHACQMISGYLRNEDGKAVKWKGREYTREDMHVDHMSTRLLGMPTIPWEVVAHRESKVIARRVLKSLGEEGLI